MVEINGLNLTPIPIGLPAEDWGRLLNQNFAIIDYHNHTLNGGVNIAASSLEYSDLYVNGYNVKNVAFLTFAANYSGGQDNYALYVNPDGDLVYNNPTYNLAITSGSGLNVDSGLVGFTVTGDPPIAIFDPAVLGIRFESSIGTNTSTIEVQTLTGFTATITTINSTNVAINSALNSTNSAYRNTYLGVILPSPTIVNFAATYNSWQVGLNTLSNTGAYYYDNLEYNPNHVYTTQYFLGSKNWVSSPNTLKQNKTGTKYYMKTLTFPSDILTIDKNFVLDDNLNNSNLVSVIPKIETTTAFALGANNSILQNMILPVVTFTLSDTTLSAYVSIDLSTYAGTFTSLTLSFKIIYANNSYNIQN